MHDFWQYFQISDSEILIRIIFSIILGFIIGLERELTNKSAGLRTQTLVCLGACIFTILSVTGFATSVSLYPMGDPSRVAAQIITGIGFIGAGTVLRHGLTVTGLTTASTLWIAAAIGMACGCGKLDIAVVSTILTVAILVIIRIFEIKLLSHNSKHYRQLKITFSCEAVDYDNVFNKISEIFPDTIDYNFKTADEDGTKIKVNAKVKSNDKSPVLSVYKRLEEVKEIKSISVKEIFD